MLTEIEFEMDDKVSRSIVTALEVNKKINRGSVNISQLPTGFKLVIDTPDLTSMRAALNTHLRLIDMLINSWEVVENGRTK